MKVIFLLFFSLVSFSAISQTTPTIPTEGVEITKAIPASPDAASLGKYGAIPVSPYTGVANISIPFYTIKTGNISLPISISYHSGGNKVEEQASSVGLGWVLNAGGAITRTIRGKADEDNLGYLDNGHYVPNIINSINNGYKTGFLNSSTVATYLNQISDGTMDGESDMYNYNFAGYSGRFVMDSYGNVMTIPQQRIKFTFTINQNGPNGPIIKSFQAVTPDGTIYTFGTNNDGNDAIEQTFSQNSCSPNTKSKYFASSWFIKSIVDPTGHQVTFNYTNESYLISQSRSQSIYQFYNINTPNTYGGTNTAPMIPESDCNVSSIIYGVKLSKINFENGQLSVYLAPRNDISGAFLVDSLTINGSSLYKKYLFYYTNNTTTRLQLDSLIGLLDYNPLNSIFNKEKYSFQYNADNWKPVAGNFNNLYNQDYWGYNNGKFTNSTLVPSAWFTPINNSTQILLAGANRNTDETSMLGGMLTKITYPTGGYTTFNYEANQEYNVDLGGTSPKYPNPPLTTAAITNDPLSYYYINPLGNKLTVISGSPNSTVQVSASATGLRPLSNNDPNYFVNYITASLYLLDASGNQTSTFYAIHNTMDTVFQLIPGTYQIVITDGKNQAYSSKNPNGFKYTVFASVQNPNLNIVHNYIVGGLRIQQISDYDGTNINPFNVKTYQYTLPGQNFSSGWLDYKPTYSYILSNNLGAISSDYYTVSYLVRTTTSNYPLSTTQGSVVGYSHVVELDGANGENGKTEYFYTNSQSDPDIRAGLQLSPFSTIDTSGFPFSPIMSHDWRRGLLLRQIIFKNNGNKNFVKVQDKVNSYISKYTGFNNNIKAGFNPTPKDYSETIPYFNDPTSNILGSLSVFNYTDYTDFTYLSGETVTDYNQNDTTNFIRTTTNFQMDSTTLLLSNLTAVNSKNEKIINNVTYSGSYSTNSVLATGVSSKGLLNLKLNNIINFPIEEVTQKSNTDGTNIRTVKAVLTTYKPTQVVKDSVYQIRSNTPITNFISSYAGPNYIIKDSHYQPVVSFDSYDATGNILQEKRVFGTLRSYIWGYPNSNGPQYNTYPIAEVLNADANSIAYTNFESYNLTGCGNWTYASSGIISDPTAPMGSGCYSINGNTITKAGLNNTINYIISFWSKQGSSVLISGGNSTINLVGSQLNGWTYNEYLVSNPSSVIIGGSGIIDELRLYPFNAQMTTYTYFPLVGISATCNSKSQLSYYQYDNIGRLLNIKDQNGNILKAYQYHYAGN